MVFYYDYFLEVFFEPPEDLPLAAVEADFAGLDDVCFDEPDLAADFPADFDEPELLSPVEDFPADDFAPLDFAADFVDLADDFAADLSLDFAADLTVDFVDDDLALEADFPADDADFLPPVDLAEDFAPDFFTTSSVAATTAPSTAPLTALFPMSAITSPAFAAALPTAAPTVSITPLSRLFPLFADALFLSDDCFAEEFFAASFFAIFSLLVRCN